MAWERIASGGKSAYEIWLDAGNSGTEQDFLDSLKGAPGSGSGGSNGYKGNITVDSFTELTTEGLWYVACSDRARYPFNVTWNELVPIRVEHFNWGTNTVYIYTMHRRVNLEVYMAKYFPQTDAGKELKWEKVSFKSHDASYDTNVLLFGNSISEPPSSRVDTLQEIIKANVAINAIGGTTLERRGEDFDIQNPTRTGYWDNKSLVNRTGRGVNGEVHDEAFYSDVSKDSPFIRNMKADFSKFHNFVIFFSANGVTPDRYGEINAGDANKDWDEYTLYGSLNKVVHNLRAHNPSARIIFITSSWRLSSNLEPYAEAIANICNKYNLPYLTLHKVQGITSENSSVFMADSVHPNKEGLAVTWSIIGNFIKANMRTKTT